MTTPIKTDAYLERIGYTGQRSPTIETLRGLHRAHLLAVPFENIDIHLGREIVLDETRLVAKIVDERRGGFCYELNGAFAALLRSMGFDVSLLSAGVATPDGAIGPDFDHMLLRVELDEPWLADVGFGDSFIEPLRLNVTIQPEGELAFQIQRDGDWLVLHRRDTDGRWTRQYRFTETPHALTDFAGMCHYHQHSPDSHFARNRVCSRLTPNGRVSLAGNRLIVTDNGQRDETAIDDEAAFADAMMRYFDIVLRSR